MEIADPVKIEGGYIAGTVLGEPGREVHIYRGIPYAAPPLAELRWKPPQAVIPWQGIRECTVFSRRAPQAEASMSPYPIPTSEDCLYLNVLTPSKKTSDKLPVMVWMHGGGYSAGHGNTPQYNALPLPQHGVVVVTVNMRLGAIGLLAHPLLSKESADSVSGNYLFLDMLAALRWVKKNISAFGGDPANITIFGESGGSAKVICLLTSPLASGLFQQAIGESGVANGKPLADLEKLGEKLFAKLGVDNDKDLLKSARALSWEKIVEADQALTRETGGPFGPWDVAVDGWFMPETPMKIFQKGRQNAVPFILGANLGELTGPGEILMPQVIFYYVEMFISARKTNVKTYAYIFDQVPAGWRNEGCVSSHAMELGYVFGTWNDLNDWAQLFPLARSAGAKSIDPGVTDEERKVSEAMIRMWTQFAKTGDPAVSGIGWPEYSESAESYLYITGPLKAKTGFSKLIRK
jgi:para-nitrobenzyl esterase